MKALRITDGVFHAEDSVSDSDDDEDDKSWLGLGSETAEEKHPALE